MLKLKWYMLLSCAVILLFALLAVLIKTDGGDYVKFQIAGGGGAALLAVNFFAVGFGTTAARKTSFFIGLGILLCYATFAVFGLFSSLWKLESLILLCVTLLASAALCCVFWGRGKFKNAALCAGIVLLIALVVSFLWATAAKPF